MIEYVENVACKEIDISTLLDEVGNNQCNFNNGNMVRNERVESKYGECTTTSIFVEKDQEVFFSLCILNVFSVYGNIWIDVLVYWMGCFTLHETRDFRERMENSTSASENIYQRIQTKPHCL